MLPSDYACPKCKCRACYALHRKGFDFIMSLFGLRPARCLTCSRRFYARYRLTEDGKYIAGRNAAQRPVPSSEAQPAQSPATRVHAPDAHPSADVPKHRAA